MENYIASNLEQVSGRGLFELAQAPHQVILQEGFEVAVQRLSEGLHVKLNQAVTRVERKEDNVEVTTASGDTWQAPKVLVTVPLGVLKKKTIEFIPPLPKSKLDCIERVGFGLLDKVVLRFPSVFWNKNAHFIMCLTSDRTLPKMFLNKAACNGKPVLVAFHQGKVGLENEGLTDAELAEKTMRCLRMMHGSDIPDPVEVVCTRWGLDPFSCGAYTTLLCVNPDEAQAKGLDNVGPTNANDTAGLRESIDKTLYFAGEHTSDEPGLIHGAYNSGIRAADEILQDLA